MKGEISHVYTLLKSLYYPKAIYRFNLAPIKIPTFFTEIEKIILKFIWNHRPSNIQNYLEHNDQSWRHHTNLKIYKATVIKVVEYCYKNK